MLIKTLIFSVILALGSYAVFHPSVNAEAERFSQPNDISALSIAPRENESRERN